MELQFQKISIPCLRQVARQVQSQEQTQEVRLNDGLPDIGRVLGAWGQVMLRGKEWRGDTISVSCGCMAWVLYAPEDGSPAQCLETWIPFNLKWEIPETERDGIFSTDCLLRSVDARATSSRKLMVRANVSVMAEAYTMTDAQIFAPAEIPEDVQVKKRLWSMRLAREAGEKPFVIDEELTLPQTNPAVEKIIHFSLLPEVTDQRVMSDKVIFRGTAVLHVLYRGQDGELSVWEHEIPFSQYAELEQTYSHEAVARVCPSTTSLELDAQEGRLRLKAGLTGQYLICDTENVELIEDAYSVLRPVTVQREQLAIPAVTDEVEQVVSAEGVVNQLASRVVDTTFYPDFPRKRQQGEEISAELPGLFQVLYYDEEGILQMSTARWEGSISVPAGENVDAQLSCRPTGMAYTSLGGESLHVQGNVAVGTVLTEERAVPLVTGLLVGETTAPDPNRPSLILRRAGQDSLWQIAKRCGSTEDAIRAANDLQEEPSPDRILLIPIV